MAKKLELKIITPEKLILDEQVESVTIPTINGEITVLADHIPIVTSLTSGDIVASSKGEYIPMAVVGGFIEVRREKNETIVIILADFAEHVSEISAEKITEAKTKAKELQKQASNNEIVDFEHFESELERSLTRIKIADKWRKRKYRK